jgi:hypothetical protein
MKQPSHGRSPVTGSHRSPGSRRLSDILADTPGLAALNARAQATQQVAAVIAPVCAEILPGFDPRSPGHCMLRGTRLRLFARNAPQAAKLRQSVSRLKSALQRQGFEGIEIELVVQPDLMPYPGGAGTATDIAPAASTAVSETGQSAAGIQPTIAFIEFSEKLALTNKNGDLAKSAASLRDCITRAIARTRERP